MRIESTTLRFLLIVVCGSMGFIVHVMYLFICIPFLTHSSSSNPVHDDTPVLSSSSSLLGPAHPIVHVFDNRHRFPLLIEALRRHIKLHRGAHQTLHHLGRPLPVCVLHDFVLVPHSLSLSYSPIHVSASRFSNVIRRRCYS
ncbi:hypothetical protein BDN70DRAFT_117027 [Pholiota conissans]|uniref:Uncharacterized protein n=1 Tax=Pholiota conissans TaxID=109636 RepID=A0A9P5YWU6_9AGAR|nr:hypothetical protein BDN70DRAFT_117027 [Pholiota conissans]